MFDKPHNRLVATVVILAALLGVYSWINGRFESAFDFGIGLDDAIPLLPWTLPLYASLYVLALLGSVLVDPQTFKRGLETLLLVAAVSFACFIAFPAAYPRPSLADIDSIWRPALEWYYSNDPPLNTLPSLHVATAVVLAWMLRRVWRWQFWVVWATVICLSTLTTKQHFIADVIAGVLVAALAIVVAERKHAGARADGVEPQSG